MKFTLLTIFAAAVSTVSAGVVITPITPDQVVAANPGDCFFGAVTPSGCGPLRKTT